MQVHTGLPCAIPTFTGSASCPTQVLLLSQVASIAKYEGKGSIALADSVKSLHVLPSLPSFTALATQVEALIQGRAVLWVDKVHLSFAP